jgi:uncharacterized Zn finger protein
MSYYDDEWPAYVPVAERLRQAARELRKLKKRGQSTAPVTIEGRTIAKSFWGKSWCTNLERYSDFESRMPRGRTYVRNGSVVDLQIAKGEVAAMVAGSLLYKIKITVAPVMAARWKAICRDCAGEINSVVELLQGRLAKGVMDRVCQQGDGLFPSPKEIKLSCDCPDSAKMCKHVAAALYGVGARLDERPQLLFKLRGVDENELLAHAGQDLALTKAPPGAANILDNSDVAALFGLDMAEATVPEAAVPDAAVPAVPKQRLRSGTSRATGTPGESKIPVVKKTAFKKKNSRPLAGPTRSKSKKATRSGAAKKESRPIGAAQLNARPETQPRSRQES